MFKLKKIIVAIYTKLFVDKKDRAQFSETLLELPLSELLEAKGYFFRRFSGPRVLILEAHPYHGEVIPGFVRYFNQLGYHVDVLTRKELLEEKPFAGLGLDVDTFAVSQRAMALVLLLSRMKKYDYALVNTLRLYGLRVQYEQMSFGRYFGRWPETKHDVMFIAHDTRYLERFFDPQCPKKKRAITLGRFPNQRMVNSHYFGEVVARDKNEVTTFVIIGAISSEIRNHQQLFDAAEALLSEEREFKVIVIGSGDVDALPEAIREHVHIKGRLNFPDMYRTLRESDFIITGLDPDNIEHERYITTGVTGTAQLCYGFEIPPLVEKKFADFYGFGHENALVYDIDLVSAMRIGIEMSNTDYTSMRSALGALAKSVRDESMKNLNDLMATD